MNRLQIVSLVVLSVSLAAYVTSRMQEAPFTKNEDIVQLFSKTTQEIDERVDAIKKEAELALNKIYKVPAEQRTYGNTMRALDDIGDKLSIVFGSLRATTMVSTEEELRKRAQEKIIELQAFSVDHFTLNPRLYKACVEYEQRAEGLTDEESYYLKETMQDFKRDGLSLPEEKQAVIKELKKKLAQHEMQFCMNIDASNRSIEVDKEGLKGLDEDFVRGLKRSDDRYILGIDYPTYFKVMDECSVGATRKALYKAFSQRAYPENVSELQEIVRLRDQLAKALGYESYAHYDIENQMTKTTKTVEVFIDDIVKRARVKADQEIAVLKKDLPEGVVLKDGKFYPWDFAYVGDQYKKKHLEVDESAIAEYFPMDHTLPALLSIYETFFGLTFKKESGKFWHEDVILLKAYKGDTYLGSVFLDLFPRPHKYSHACKLTLVSGVQREALDPAVLIVIANFPPAVNGRPSLLPREDVITFFHEFGHAIHTLLGHTKIASFAGTRTKRDFVELPSQMLEEWMWDAAILKKVSCHYKTKEPFSDELIKKIQALKNVETGDHVMGQMCYASIALAYFKSGADKDLAQIWKTNAQGLRNHLVFDEDNHRYCSFGHLTGYGSKYYGYMWSKVFALDLFSHIKPQGLLNPAMGTKYAQEILGKGGSVDPYQMLTVFLGREPNSDAFFKDMGI